MARTPSDQDLRVHRVLECVERVESLVLRIEDASAHDGVEAAQGGNQQMQPVGADRRLIRRLDEPAFNATRLQHTPGLEQEQPRVLAHRLRSSVPGVAMLGQEAEPGSQHGEVRIACARCADALHEAVPLVERHHKLALNVEDQTFITRSAGWVSEVSWEAQRARAVQAAELAARSSLGTHNGQRKAASHHT